LILSILIRTNSISVGISFICVSILLHNVINLKIIHVVNFISWEPKNRETHTQIYHRIRDKWQQLRRGIQSSIQGFLFCIWKYICLEHAFVHPWNIPPFTYKNPDHLPLCECKNLFMFHMGLCSPGYTIKLGETLMATFSLLAKSLQNRINWS
jgi:hypothetical protein